MNFDNFLNFSFSPQISLGLKTDLFLWSLGVSWALVFFFLAQLKNKMQLNCLLNCLLPIELPIEWQGWLTQNHWDSAICCKTFFCSIPLLGKRAQSHLQPIKNTVVEAHT